MNITFTKLFVRIIISTVLIFGLFDPLLQNLPSGWYSFTHSFRGWGLRLTLAISGVWVALNTLIALLSKVSGLYPKVFPHPPMSRTMSFVSGITMIVVLMVLPTTIILTGLFGFELIAGTYFDRSVAPIFFDMLLSSSSIMYGISSICLVVYPIERERYARANYIHKNANHLIKEFKNAHN